MSVQLLNTLNRFLNIYRSANDSLTEECVSKIDHQVFYQFTPDSSGTVLITLSFAFTRQRRNMLLSCLGGRPGLAFPMDSLTPSRISYACAFGATAFLAYDIVMEGRLIIDTPVDKTARSFAAILSVLVYGMVFFPVFACLALSSVFGFVLGALYVPVEGRKAAMQAAAKRLVYQFVYHRKKGFRYPARILSVMLLGVMVVYIVSVQSLYIFYVWQLKSNAKITTFTSNTLISFIFFTLLVFHVYIYLKACVVCVLCVVLRRNNLLALYKGDHSNIPPAEAGGNVSYCVNSIKYGGFQVGYIVWGFIIQFAVLTLICFLLAIVVLLLEGGYYQWILDLLLIFWPVILVTVIIMVTQNLLARFVFLQGRGIYLALDNRFCFFIFTYFMFFYNIFLGLISCLLRIVKAIVLGIIFLGRLDNSTLSRKFEFFDPGFSAYRGFMHMECAHTHPVVIVFARLVIQTWEASKQGRVPQSVHSTEGEMDVKVKTHRRRSMKARSNWQVTYTLLHNPELRVTRKGFMQLLRQARELGVHIPISDNQANINVDSLAEQIQQAKDLPKSTHSKKEMEAKIQVNGKLCGSLGQANETRQGSVTLSSPPLVIFTITIFTLRLFIVCEWYWTSLQMSISLGVYIAGGIFSLQVLLGQTVEIGVGLVVGDGDVYGQLARLT
ncbi:hypothetical protein C0Q70_21126 [Pomacea canaliculata]|uniref:Receptor for retinol uptake STRA6 n=1 Tax=Pomacea canaliculata TaxID=400727 RepID=A0A2T7NBL7_POMCA|nr:hypothetical protein C0Q70_21126 [Pomacea canaliculata]